MIRSKFAVFVASGMYSGFAPFAPGTFGSLVGSVIVYLLLIFSLIINPWTLLTLSIFSFLIGYWAIKALPDSWIHDDQRIVIDEVLGIFISLCFLPISIQTILLSLVLFRLYDIFKPLGIRSFDNLSSDMSVLLDDALAGVYANLTLQIIIIVLPL